MIGDRHSFDAVVPVEWTKDGAGGWKMEEVPGSAKFFPVQLVEVLFVLV